VVVELAYRVPLTPWLTITPDFQYVVSPNADPSIGDAAVIGARVQVNF
jgi:porin